jgi:hypothetical protein
VNQEKLFRGKGGATMQTEIAGIKITYHKVEDLREKAQEVLAGIQKSLEDIDKQRAELKKKEKVIKKFLDIKPQAKNEEKAEQQNQKT